MPLSYLLAALLLTLPLWLGRQPRLLGYGADTAMHLWFLNWFPYAIGHGLNPFQTSIATHPSTVSLLWNNADLALALLAWPLFRVLPAAAAMDLVFVLMMAAAAAALAWQLRPHVRHASSAWLGGLLFGFSPFALSELAAGHLTWVSTATLPLGWWAGERAWRAARDGRHPVRWGMVLGGWAVLQYWVSKELLATTLLMAVLLLVLNSRGILRRGLPPLRRLWPVVAGALAVFGALMVYPVISQLTSGVPLSRPTVVSPAANVVDLLEWVVPGYAQLMGIGPAGALSLRYTGELLETDAYLGLPLLAMAALAAWRLRGAPLARLGAGLAGVAGVLSLGGQLHVAGVVTRVPLPWLLFEHLPLLGKAVPSRLTIFVVAGVACLLAAGWDRVMERFELRSRALILGVALLPLLPSSGLMAGIAGFPVYTPRVLSSAALRGLPAGASVLTIPITTRENHGLAMYWQAEQGFRYSQPFGYLLRPGPGGVLTDNLSPSPLANLATALSSGDAHPVGVSAAAVRLELRRLGVRALVLMPSAQFAADERELRGILGHSPELVDGAAIWPQPGA
ncbi:MAG: hypothetical protein M0T72_02765 [Candidatus Dormibacteraeota bacterium]|nr:hypothetical protein [Candidatus Dormibacteraeota bacterium]